MGEEPDRVAMVSDVRAEVAFVRGELSAVRAGVDSLATRVDNLEAALKARIKEEGETTRRHFNIIVEKVESAVKLIAEGHTHQAIVLDDHETRIATFEKRRT